MKRLFTMGLALLMVLTMVPMSCHASNLDAGIGAESVMLASMTVSAVAVDKPVDMGDNQDSSEDWRVVTEEDGSVSCRMMRPMKLLFTLSGLMKTATSSR